MLTYYNAISIKFQVCAIVSPADSGGPFYLVVSDPSTVIICCRNKSFRVHINKFSFITVFMD